MFGNPGKTFYPGIRKCKRRMIVRYGENQIASVKGTMVYAGRYSRPSGLTEGSSLFLSYTLSPLSSLFIALPPLSPP